MSTLFSSGKQWRLTVAKKLLLVARKQRLYYSNVADLISGESNKFHLKIHLVRFKQTYQATVYCSLKKEIIIKNTANNTVSLKSQ